MSKRYPAKETTAVRFDRDSGHPVEFICGIPVQPNQTEPVSLRSRHHPGFGVVTLLRNGVRVPMGEHSSDNWTLQKYENRARKNPNARWELEVHGPMSGYTLRRIRGGWYVTETNRGFA